MFSSGMPVAMAYRLRPIAADHGGCGGRERPARLGYDNLPGAVAAGDGGSASSLGGIEGHGVGLVSLHLAILNR